MDERVKEAIKLANERLKKNKAGVSIYCMRHSRLWLQGTFPPKPYVNDKTKPFQQKLCLSLPATIAGVAEAERRAKLIGAELELGKFDWRDWLDEPEKLETAGEWVKRFEANYWSKRKRTQQSETTWETDYRAVFKKLPSDEPLTADMLVKLAIATEPDSRSRKRYCEVLSRLAKFAGLPSNALAELKGGYSPQSVKPRDLPDDAEICRVRDLIKSRSRPNSGWLWIYSVVAAYGLRPHEAFHANLDNFPELQVREDSKTGWRFVFPLYPEWAQQWDLKNKVLPNLQNIDQLSNAELGTKVSGWFFDTKIPFPAYTLRHCYARRCFEFGLSPDFGAKLMGHSIETHEKVYRAWIDKNVYQRLYNLAIHKDDRPLPPSHAMSSDRALHPN